MMNKEPRLTPRTLLSPSSHLRLTDPCSVASTIDLSTTSVQEVQILSEAFSQVAVTIDTVVNVSHKTADK